MIKVALYNQTKNQTIQLNTQTTINIGRGFFECNDHRVSRNHGEITVLEDQIKVKACHVNPIFYKKNGDNIQHILEKDSEIILTNADKFSLLPEDFEYEIKIMRDEIKEPIAVTDLRIRAVAEINGNIEAKIIVTPDKDESRTTPYISSSTSPSPNEARTEDQSSEQPTNRKRSIECENEARSSKKPKSVDKFQSIVIKADPDAMSSNFSVTAPDSTATTDFKLEPNASSPSEGSSSVKLQVKIENSTENTSEVKPNQMQTGMRLSCEHGIRCYRHTPEHRLEAAHPADADYRRPNFPPAPPNTPNCPFGASCYRRNPEHFKQLSHPPSSVYSTQPLARVVNVAQSIVHGPSIQNNDGHEELSEEEAEEEYDDSDFDQDYVADEISDEIEEDEENNLEE